MSLYCSQCGQENDEKNQSCWSCGSVISQKGPEALLGKTVFDSYVLEEILGQGGMAVVYLGRNQLTDQKVAVKVLPPELAVYSEVKIRFIDEARTLAKLEHPNVVHLINFAEDLGRLCLVMQYAEGDTLEDILDTKGRMEPREAIRVIVQVLDAMQHAHDQHVIHRDIKPSNIILRRDGSVKVTDFGIAKIVRSTKLTQDGQTMGTVRYMSPEQVQGGDIDPRSDLYSLGITLYECLVGEPPFDGDNHFKIMNQHLKDAPKPLTQMGASISSSLESVVLKVIAKKPEERFASAAGMKQALLDCPEADSIGRAKGRTKPLFSKKAVTKAAVSQIDSAGDTGRRIWLIALIGAIAVGVGVILFFVAGSFFGEGESSNHDDAGGDNSSTVSEVTAGSKEENSPEKQAVERWMKEKHPKLKALEKKVRWVVKMENKEKPYLRVLSSVQMSTDEIESLYKKSLIQYPKMLKAERVSEKVVPRPLVIVFIKPETFRDPEIWGGEVEADVRYYPLPVATLFLPKREKETMSLVLYGFASHLCPARLSSSDCHRLAERFEKYSLSR